MSEPLERVAVGKITRAHGVHGAVLVLPLSDIDERFDPGSALFLGGSGERRLTIVERKGHRDRPLVRFDGVADRTTAETLAGEYLFVDADQTPPLPPGEFWPHQLIGLPVHTTSGLALGELRDVLRTTANDVWVVVDDAGRETLVPALKDVVLGVDRTTGVTVAEVPGLTVPERD